MNTLLLHLHIIRANLAIGTSVFAHNEPVGKPSTAVRIAFPMPELTREMDSNTSKYSGTAQGFYVFPTKP